MTELHWLTAAEAGRGFRDRTLSPVELLKALLERAEKLNPTLDIYVALDADRALAQAKIAETEIAAGKARGPLHGVPVGLKDIIDLEGLPTTCGSKILQDNVAKADAHGVALLREAGMVFPGKVQTLEFALGGPSFDLPKPPSRNPWNRDHHPGGSSSGSGAGVAAGFFPVALGSDTGGSIRNPASCCGAVGLKPTYGLVSRRGVFPLAFSLDHLGPLSRTVEDSALVLDALAQQDPLDPASRPRPDAASYARDLWRGVKGMKIGFVRHFHERDMPADPEMAASLEEAARFFAAEGATVRDVTLPDLNEFSAVNRNILQAEAWTIHQNWMRTRPGDYGQIGRRRLASGAFLTASDYLDAQRRRLKMIEANAAVFREVDVLLCASSMDPPCRIDDLGAIAKTYPRQARTPFNVTGEPAITLMSGLSKGGLPLSIQIAGPHWGEAKILQAAAAYERATQWHKMRPKEAA